MGGVSREATGLNAAAAVAGDVAASATLTVCPSACALPPPSARPSSSVSPNSSRCGTGAKAVLLKTL